MKRLLMIVAVLALTIPAFGAGKKLGLLKAKNKIPNSYIVVLENRTEDVDGAASDLINGFVDEV